MRRSISSLYMSRLSVSVLALGSVLGSAMPAAADETADGKAAQLDTLFITASPLTSQLDELAVPATIVVREDILTSSASTIGALLGGKPGITESSFAAGASRPIIRGLDNTRVRVQENGIGSGDVSAVSEDHGVSIDPLSAKRVEVVRGPATLRYGSEAIGGVVNVINNRIPTALPRDGFEGEVSASYDTVDYGRRGYAEMNAGADNLVFHADTFTRKTENYRIPGPVNRQGYTWTESAGIAGGASVLLDNNSFGGHAGLSVSHYDSEYGIPAPGDPTNPVHIEMRQTKVQAASELEFSSGFFSGLALSGGYSDYSHGEIDAAGDTGSRFDNKEWEGRAELLHRAVGPFTGAIGVQGRSRELKAEGEGGELIAPAHTDAIAGFLFEEMPLSERLKFQVAGRIEYVDVTGTAFDMGTASEYALSRDFTPMSASTGLVLSLDGGWVLGATAQHVERAPDALELFSKGPHEATETFELGDPTLGKEKALSFELNARRMGDDYSFEAAVFHTSFKDFIYKRLTGELCDDDFATCTVGGIGIGTELDQVIFTQTDATFRGIEAAGSVTLVRWGSARAGVTGQFDMVRAELDAGGNVPRIPPVRAGAGVFYASDDISGRLGFLHAFSQDELGANETETGSYTKLDAEIRYLVPVTLGGNTALELAVVGENLLDHDIRNHVSFKKADVLQPGRNVRFVATARF